MRLSVLLTHVAFLLSYHGTVASRYLSDNLLHFCCTRPMEKVFFLSIFTSSTTSYHPRNTLLRANATVASCNDGPSPCYIPSSRSRHTPGSCSSGTGGFMKVGCLKHCYMYVTCTLSYIYSCQCYPSRPSQHRIVLSMPAVIMALKQQTPRAQKSRT